jgi:hypothetical protein
MMRATMARTSDLARLFVTTRRRGSDLAPYPTLAAELDAVRAGSKGMSQLGFLVSSMTNGDPDVLELLELAFRRDLTVVIHNRRWLERRPLERQAPDVYVARPTELWRIPAWLTLWDSAGATGGWTDAAEEQSSLLLGYDRAQRARWRANWKHRRPAWGAAPVYALLTGGQKRRVASLGRRCLGSAEDLDGMTLFIHREDYGVVRDAHRSVPRGLTLARVGMRWPTFRKLFGEPSSWKRAKVIEATVPTRLAREVTESLASNVQFLTARGWR